MENVIVIMVGLLTGGATLKWKIDVIKEGKNKRNVISVCYNTTQRTEHYKMKDKAFLQKFIEYV